MKHSLLIRTAIAAIAVLSLGFFLGEARGWFSDIPFDDAFMYTRYAKHWLAGKGFSWNAGDGGTYGCTSTAYLLLITALRGLTGLSDSNLLIGASLVAGVCACVALCVAGFLATERVVVRKTWLPLLTVPALLFSGTFRYHSSAGMETTLSLFANSVLGCCVLLWARRPTAGRLAVTVAAAYFAFLVRPDNGLWCLALPPLFLYSTSPTLWRRALAYVAVFVAILAVDAGIKFFLFNDVIPLPALAKEKGAYVGYLAPQVWNPGAYLLEFIRAGLPFFVLIVLFCRRGNLPRLIALAVPLVLTFAYYATVVQIMGHRARFYYPSLAFVAMAAFLSFDREEGDSRPDLARGRVEAAVRGVAVLALVFLATSKGAHRTVAAAWERLFIPAPTEYQARTQYVNKAGRPLPRIEKFRAVRALTRMLEKLPPDITLVASEHGLLSSSLPDVDIIDAVGLHDRVIAHQGFSAAYIMSRKPDIIWMPHPDYSRVVAEILDNPAFIDEYDYYPGALAYGLALWRKSEYYGEMNRVLVESLPAIHGGRQAHDYLAKPVIPGGRE